MFIKQPGLTLIEILLVITLIAILAAAILVAIDPARRMAQARNARRWEECEAILNAVLKYMVDHEGEYPSGLDNITTSAQVLGTASNGCDTTCGAVTTVSSCLDLSSDLVGRYIASIPKDPKTGTAANTDYYINKTSDGRVRVGACDPELSEVIFVER